MRNKREPIPVDLGNKITISTEELASVLSCGRNMAYKVGMDSGAMVKIGKRTLWNVESVKRYINNLSSNPLTTINE